VIRVLVVDDSATVRTLLTQILGEDPEIQIVGEACDGEEAIRFTEWLRPDLITMDILMPRLDGLAATKEIMIRFPTPIVLVTSSQKAREVESSLASLGNGALDVLEKPIGPLAPQFEESSARLIATVKGMSQVKVIRHWRHASTPSVTAKDLDHWLKSSSSGFLTPKDVRSRVVAIVASTGGPAALQTLLSHLPGDFPVPILIVQHITPGFADGLVAWLKCSCQLEVKLAENGEKLLRRTVYIAPDGQHLGVSKLGTVALSTAAPIRGFRPSGTFLFESVARAFGLSSLAVILTGMGEDGVAGLSAVRRAGGRIIAQNEATSVIFGMPGTAIASGVVDVVLPLDEIAARIASLV